MAEFQAPACVNSLALLPGFEPSPTEPKSAVLPITPQESVRQGCREGESPCRPRLIATDSVVVAELDRVPRGTFEIPTR